MRAEPDEAHLFTGFQRLTDRLEHRIDRSARLRFSQFGLAGDGVDEFVPVHGPTPCAAARHDPIQSIRGEV